MIGVTTWLKNSTKYEYGIDRIRPSSTLRMSHYFPTQKLHGAKLAALRYTFAGTDNRERGKLFDHPHSLEFTFR